MAKTYDVIIVGAGPAGIFAALELAKSGRRRILMVEQGADPVKRHRQVRRGKGSAWQRGWGGAGAFSDGKLTLTPDVGGFLGEIIGEDSLKKLIDSVDRVYCRHGAPKELSGGDGDDLLQLKEKAQRSGLRFIPTLIRHMGTDRTGEVLRSLYAQLEGTVEIRFGTAAKKILTGAGRFRGVEFQDGTRAAGDAGIIAPGRAGSAWLKGEAERIGLETSNNPVDIGVRVEVPAVVLKDVTEITHEAKLVYYSRSFDDKVRTFCMNPYGEVVTEHNEGIVTVNGHSFRNRKTSCTNFAILVSTTFTEPFNDPISYGMNIARLANLLSGGVLVQRLGDLRAGRRSTAQRIEKSVIRPTLAGAIPGDLSFVLPFRYLADIEEMLVALDRIAPGVASSQTLLYGVEVKFYSVRFRLSRRLESEVKGLFIIGDGAGISRGLVQASASGVIAARAIASRRR